MTGGWHDLTYVDGYLSPLQRAARIEPVVAAYCEKAEYVGSLEERLTDTITDCLLLAELGDPGIAEQIVYFALKHCKYELDGADVVGNGFAVRP